MVIASVGDLEKATLYLHGIFLSSPLSIAVDRQHGTS